MLTNCSPVSDSTYIYTANGSPLVVTHSGNITPTYSPLLDKLTLPSVFCIPKLTMKLLSVGKLTDYDSNVLFTLTSSIVQDHTGRTIGTGRKVNGLYQLESLHLSSSPHPAASFSVTSDIWHRQLGHLSTSRLKTMSDSNVLEKFQFTSSNNCEGCRFAKQIDIRFGSSNHMASEIFDLVHSDI